MTRTEGGFSCVIERNATTTVFGVKYDLDNIAYHLLLATGSSASGKFTSISHIILRLILKFLHLFIETGIGYHDLGRDASTKQFLGELGDFGRTSRLIYKLHGEFMIIAWIGTTSLGIIFARYFKDQFSGAKPFNKDIWFIVSIVS